MFMLNILFLDFNFLSNFQLDYTNFTVLEYIIKFKFYNITGIILVSTAIILLLPIFLGSVRAGFKRVWDGTKWVLVATTSGIAGSAGGDIYKEIKTKIKTTGNNGGDSNNITSGTNSNNGNSGTGTNSNNGNSGTNSNNGNSGTSNTK